jgi:hypothetical protein
MQSFESSITRLRAIYRIPTTADTQRVLELHVGEPGPVLDDAWPASSAISCRIVDRVGAAPPSTVEIAQGFSTCDVPFAGPLPFAAGSFDMAVLHFTLDGLANVSRSRRSAPVVNEWLARVAQVLRPGGIVAGCESNATSPMARAGRPRSRPPMSVLTCARVLGRAGFADVQVFNLIPDAAEPRAIVSVENKMSRRAFAHEIQSARESVGLAGYLVRSAMVQLSIHRLVEPVMFYWAIRRC